MNIFVAVTDNEWFHFLSKQPGLEEVNFWKPSGKGFGALKPGEPLLFKLHRPLNDIAGGGFFAHFTAIPATLAWDAFGIANGAASLDEVLDRIEHYRSGVPDPHRNYTIGCIVLTDPFFFPPDQWIPVPSDFSRNTQVGKKYPLESVAGRALWSEVLLRLRGLQQELEEHPVAPDHGQDPLPYDLPMYGDPAMIRPRLGQGAFRLLVTDTYQRRCAVTHEKALPVLEAAHIQPVSRGGRHRVDNGLLLRSDIHRLYDRGYVTITPDYRFRVSSALKDEFDNGEPYYPLQDNEIWLPRKSVERPNRAFLEWHSDSVFRG